MRADETEHYHLDEEDDSDHGGELYAFDLAGRGKFRNLFRETSIGILKGNMRKLAGKETVALEIKFQQIERHRPKGSPPQIEEKYLKMPHWDLVQLW